jgi:hypothetical protein
LRQKLVSLYSSRKDEAHIVLAKLRVQVTCSDIFGVWEICRLPESVGRLAVPILT